MYNAVTWYLYTLCSDHNDHHSKSSYWVSPYILQFFFLSWELLKYTLSNLETCYPELTLVTMLRITSPWLIYTSVTFNSPPPHFMHFTHAQPPVPQQSPICSLCLWAWSGLAWQSRHIRTDPATSVFLCLVHFTIFCQYRFDYYTYTIWLKSWSVMPVAFCPF